MTTGGSASVLIIDDRPDDFSKDLEANLKKSGLKATTLHPSELGKDSLTDVDLILVDYYLEDWKERDELGDAPALQPQDGLALSAILRSHVRTVEKKSPTAIALITSKLPELMSPLPPDNRAHIISRVNGVEWIFDKNDSAIHTKAISLAHAVRQLPQKWTGQKELRDLLNITSLPGGSTESSLTEDACRDVLRCIPPIHELSTWSHGISFIRWFLQRVLPYPCFLIDSIQISARLRLDAEALSAALSKEAPLEKIFNPYLYKGILAEFNGQMWWRAGIEAFLWEKTAGRSFEISSVHKAINNISGIQIPASKPSTDPVVCYDKNLKPLKQFEAMETAVRIWPDDWPAYAEQPWISIAQARADADLLALVIEEDRGRI